MPKIVEVPGVGTVEFPDSMADQDISRQLRLHTPEPERKGSPEWANWRNQRVKDLNEHAASPNQPEDKSALRMLWDKVNPFGVLTAPGAGGGDQPGQGLIGKTIQGVVRAGLDQAGKAADSFHRGDYLEAAGHAGAAALPVVGPMAANFGEHVGDAAGAALGGGSNPNAMKEAATDVLAAAIPAGGAKLLSRVKSVPVIPPLENPNPAVAEAVRWGVQNGVPVDAGTATGNAAVKAVKHIADRSLAGSVVAGRENQAAAEALAGAGRRVAAQIHPSPVVPEQAGRGIQDAVQSSSDAAGSRARAAYADLERIQADPQHLQTVQTGTKTHTVTGANGQPVTDAQGNPLTVTIPQTQQIAMPVDMRPVKQALQPVFDQLSERMTPAQREADPSLNAIRNILQRPDHLPAAVADKDLGYLKGIQRGSGSDQVRHFAGQAIDALDQQVQDAVAGAGPNAVRALSRGRAATIDKYAARGVLKSLRDEPVQAFNQAVWRNDAGIDQLRAVQRFAPAEMPKLGRAFVDNLIDKATAEGDFNKAQGLWGQWQNLGPETKKIIFRDPAQIKALDNFFLLAKKMGENPNPSGTAHVASLTGQGIYTITNPVTGIPMQIAGAGLAKMLSSPRTAQALADGLRVPIGKRGAAMFAATRVLSLAGRSAEPISAQSQQTALPAAESTK